MKNVFLPCIDNSQVKKSFLLLLFFAILFNNETIAQHYKEQNLFIEGGVRYGTALYHPQSAIYLKNLYYGGLEVRFGKQTNGKNQWERMLYYPSYGVTLKYSSYYNFFDSPNVRKERNKVMGQSIVLSGYFQGSFFRYKWLNWNYQIGMGAAYFTKIYRKEIVYKPDILTPDPDNPNNYINENGESTPYPDNCLISLYVTPYINLQMGFDFQLTNQFDLCLNASFNHASNASINMPNFGINELQGVVSMRYHFSPKREFLKIDTFPKFKPQNSLFFTIEPGFLIARYDDNYYFKTGVSLGYMRSFLPVLRAGASFEAFYVRYLAHSRDYNKEEWEKPNSPRIPMPKDIYTGAVYGFVELAFGRYALHVGAGIYVFKGPGQAKTKDLAQNWDNGGTLKRYPLLYEKIGFRIYLGKNLNYFVGASLRAHAPVADYLAFNFGFKLVVFKELLNRKGRKEYIP
ncbi:MAG: acyloxyacyl hydrolase [Bacteroidetes bacterium]|nr:acyloxyacyl hydrolase [Bacteroidota bacterium]MCL1969052.1 acyloxyacyl hydrolase [Bacteroidota bacterium]